MRTRHSLEEKFEIVMESLTENTNQRGKLRRPRNRSGIGAKVQKIARGEGKYLGMNPK
ncbi:MAG: hypothetical protein M1290_04570 [Candidatus Thermoplasmatota archaeon]|jgi:hypothetical protein|nr:hypothetical protein [Candidatus Thermoplasmatota archaeon]